MAHVSGDKAPHLLVLVFNESVTKEEVKTLVDGVPEITYWYRPMPSMYLLVSEVGVESLDDIIDRAIFRPKSGRMYFLAEIKLRDVNGRLPKKFWHALEHPRSPRMPE